MRGLRTTIALVVVLGGLFAYIYFVTWKQPAEDAGSKQEKVFASLAADKDKIEELRVASESGETSALKKEKDGWRLVEPVTAAASDTEVSAITSALSQLEIVRVIDENPASLNDYGLSSPRIAIDFRTSGDKELKRLLIGQKSPTGSNLFAKRNAEKRVFLIPAFQEPTFNRRPFDLRDKAALRFDRDKVDRIDIDAGGKVVEIAKTGSDWNLTKPVQVVSDSAAVEGLIGKVQSTQMKSVVTENATPADLKKYGLDKPSMTLTVGLGSAKATLLVGGTADGTSVYARDASQPVVMTLENSLADELRKGADEYRRKDLFAFRAYDANRIEITRGGQTMAFDKVKGEGANAEDKWRRTSPNAADADKEKMSVLLAKIEGLRASAFVGPGEKTGLDSPVMTVYAKFDDGKKEERVKFGKAGNGVYASRAGDSDVARVIPAEFDEILKKLDELAK